MMSKFEPGTKIRAIRDTHSDFRSHPAGTEFVVGPSRYGGMKGHEIAVGPEGGNHTQFIVPADDFELVPDPSKFKAGDTIRATREGNTADGEVKFNEGDTFTVLAVEPDDYDGVLDVKIVTPGSRWPDGWVSSTRFELAVPKPLQWSDVKAGDTVTFRDTTDDSQHTAVATGRRAGNVLVLGAYIGSFLTRDTRELLSIQKPVPYVPTLDLVRDAYVADRHSEGGITSQEAEAEFDRFVRDLGLEGA